MTIREEPFKRELKELLQKYNARIEKNHDEDFCLVKIVWEHEPEEFWLDFNDIEESNESLEAQIIVRNW